MKARRLLELLMLLQTSDRTTVRELAAELEVSERTILRDVAALGEAGIPVQADRGPSGAISLAAGYRKALTQLSADDLHSLLVLGVDPLTDLGLHDRRPRVVRQLLGALPHRERATALRAQGRVYVDQRRWFTAGQPFDALRALREAVFDDRSIAFDYLDRRGARTTRRADPLGLVFKTGVWYLAARTSDGLRTFRVDRMAELQVRHERFERPPSFDLAAYWNEGTRSLEEPVREYWVTLRLAPQLMSDALASAPHEVIDRDAGIVRIDMGSAGDAAWRLFMWSDAAEVVGPPELIERLVQRSRAMLDRYESAVRTR